MRTLLGSCSPRSRVARGWGRRTKAAARAPIRFEARVDGLDDPLVLYLPSITGVPAVLDTARIWRVEVGLNERRQIVIASAQDQGACE